MTDDQAAIYLARDEVLHWIAEVDGGVVGHLLCYVEHRRRGSPKQLLLYEIGVRAAWRRQGVGRALITEMRSWMEREGVREAWVPSDSGGAFEFYSACGFVLDADQPIQMTLTISGEA